MNKMLNVIVGTFAQTILVPTVPAKTTTGVRHMNCLHTFVLNPGHLTYQLHTESVIALALLRSRTLNIQNFPEIAIFAAIRDNAIVLQLTPP